MCTEGERNGAFVVATLCETITGAGNGESEGDEERKKLKSWFGKKERNAVRDGSGRGKDLLLEKLVLL